MNKLFNFGRDLDKNVDTEFFSSIFQFSEIWHPALAEVCTL